MPFLRRTTKIKMYGVPFNTPNMESKLEIVPAKSAQEARDKVRERFSHIEHLGISEPIEVTQNDRMRWEMNESIMIVCRDIAGTHTGGPDCFCYPTKVIMDGKTTEKILAEVEKAQRLQ